MYNNDRIDMYNNDVGMYNNDLLLPRRMRNLFVFNDTIEGPRAPTVKPGRVTQA